MGFATYHTERATAHIIEPDPVAELHALRVAPVLAANTELDIAAHRLRLLHRRAHQLTHTPPQPSNQWRAGHFRPEAEELRILRKLVRHQARNCARPKNTRQSFTSGVVKHPFPLAIYKSARFAASFRTALSHRAPRSRVVQASRPIVVQVSSSLVVQASRLESQVAAACRAGEIPSRRLPAAP
jgi:hypothetical protein